MRHSVLVRFLALSLLVALGAVIATAVLATYSTSEQLQGEVDASASQLVSDGEIYTELLNYAGEHPSWSGVGEVVQTLANRTGRRIAVTTADGSVVADSARSLGAGPELPSRPAATLDVTAQGAVFGGAMISSSSTVAGRPATKPLTQVSMVGSPDWRMTDEERSTRKALAQEAVSCLRAAGHDAVIMENDTRTPQVAIREVNATGDMYLDPKGLTEHPCVPPGLYAASAVARTVNADEVARSIACLTAAGEDFGTSSDLQGLRYVTPAQSTKTDTAQTPVLAPPSATFLRCTEEARTAALSPYVAPPARLYLGSSDNFNVFSGEGMLRTAATALGVLLIATVVTVLAGRRLVRPIHALTGAAHQMAYGHRGTRVPVTGNDEVARLGHAFNAMAASIERHDHQRKALVSDVAHELRTPLANIKGYLVASEDGVVPMDRALVGSLLEEADLLERLVVDLQDLALADAGMLRLHPEPRDVSDLARQVVAAHRPQAEATGVRLTADTNGPAPAMVDGARIRQAVGNLVANAIRFTPSGGRVDVSVRSSGGVITVAVADTGTGITAEHLPHLFDRFYRVEGSRSRATGGSGLGLAITKHLIEAHQGRIGVASTPGQGSTFTLRLPSNLGPHLTHHPGPT
jgi:two-component system sensor histidine kinase BaeS